MTPRLRHILFRGLRLRCPSCGQGRLFKRWYTLHDRCAVCAWPATQCDGDTWAFMYLSTAGLTGLLVVLMFLMSPPSLAVGRVYVVVAALLLIVGTLPLRKSVALALAYLLALRAAPPAADHAPDAQRPHRPC